MARLNFFDWYVKRLPLPMRRNDPILNREGKKIGFKSYVPGIEQKYDTEQPWIVYTYGRTPDTWWPFWRSTRILGRAAIECKCAVCGESKTLVLRLPRIGKVPVPEGGQHVERLRFKLEHLHKDRGHQMSWSQPLLNPDAGGGLDLDMLAMRLEADLKEALDAQDE